jgi:enoyl-CoA hydratase
MFSDLKDILVTRDGRLLTLTLNRPDTLNAFSMGLHDELGHAFALAATDPDSDVIVLTGQGRAFSAGGDLGDAEEAILLATPDHVKLRGARMIVNNILDCPKPVIARVNGDAIGLGATVALLSDIIIAVDTARFADPHVRIGLTAGDGGALIWPQLVGFARAKQYLLTGDLIAAPEAERIGLINFSVPAAELDGMVEKYARKLLGGAQRAIQYTKAATNVALRQLCTSAFELSLAYELLTMHTDDHREGLQAFRERRKPGFSGK